MKTLKKHLGFTLIELSIVLVIIGLIIGGVTVGRDLINAAAIRAQVSQFEKFDAAVYAFRSKYGGLPGDIAASQAAAFGFASRTGAAGHGDGDGVLESADGVAAGTLSSLTCESALFWNDLAFANLIEGNFALDVDSPGAIGTITFAAGQQSQYLPDAKIGGGASVVVFSITKSESSYSPSVCGQGNFCYALAGNMTAQSGSYHGAAGVTPTQAFAIDSKIDDGVANAGKVQGSNYSSFAGISYLDTGGVFNTNATVVGTCLATYTSGVYSYNTGDSTTADKPVCIMNVAHK